MKVIIAGTGAMGATYGANLALANNDVQFLDGWDKNIEAIKSHGLKIHNVDKDEVLNVPICKPEEYEGHADLIIVFTKSMQLDRMMQSIQHLIDENTSVLCLLNGLGHIDTLKKYVDEKNILMGVTVLTAGMKGPGEFATSAHGKTEIQNIGKGGEEKAKLVAKTLSDATLPCEYSTNIMFSIWRKACLNGTMNANCAILDCNMRKLGMIPNTDHVLHKIVEEFAMVAKVEGVMLDVEEIYNYVMFFVSDKFSGVDHYPSMHQDLITHTRNTEIDYLNGYVARKAKEHGLDAPYCDLITYYVHGREIVLQGK